MISTVTHSQIGVVVVQIDLNPLLNAHLQTLGDRANRREQAEIFQYFSF